MAKTGEGRWKVRKWPKCRFTTVWEVFAPDGSPSGAFDSWAEAMQWATSIGDRVEYWLAHQKVS